MISNSSYRMTNNLQCKQIWSYSYETNIVLSECHSRLYMQTVSSDCLTRLSLQAVFQIYLCMLFLWRLSFESPYWLSCSLFLQSISWSSLTPKGFSSQLILLSKYMLLNRFWEATARSNTSNHTLELRNINLDTYSIGFFLLHMNHIHHHQHKY